MEPESARVLNRESALGLLRVISDGLKPATDLFVGLVDEDVSLVRSHPAAELLDELMDAFVDLESGKTHCVFEPAPYGANASLTIGERKWDDEVLAAVMGIKRAKGFKTRKKAEEFLAAKLNAGGRKHRGTRRYTAALLKTLRDGQTKRKPLARQK